MRVQGSGFSVQGSGLEAQRPRAAPRGVVAERQWATAICRGLLLSLFLFGVSCRRVERPGAVSGEPAPDAQTPEVITTPGGFEMVSLPAGTFRMGSDAGEEDEAPVHEVSLDAFWIDRYEVTQKQWARLAGQDEWLAPDPANFKGADRPVEMISWDLAALFCNVRSQDEGLKPCYDETGKCNFAADGYRLPTEAEWEYACRAGSGAEYHFGPDPRLLKQHAWYTDNASKKTHPVGRKKPNAWGLFDMHGNVAEWCNDVYDEGYYRVSPGKNPRGPADGEQYVLRGGAWSSTADACRSARRFGEDPGFADACFARDAIGFRCVRSAATAHKAKPTAEAAAEQEQEEEAGAEPSNGNGGDEHQPTQDAEKTMHDQTENDRAEAARDGSPRAVGFVYDDVYLEHKTGFGHVERPERLEAVVQRLEGSGLLSKLVRIEPQAASTEWVTTVHSRDYVERVRRSCEGEAHYFDSMDTIVSERSYEAALAAAGGVLAAADAVVAGKVSSAFCAVRPPGHHAIRDRALGFCLFNNVAIAARYVQKKHELEKVLIVDWDVHHGNGTQATFYDDPSVLYFSVHQYPFYPGSGAEGERGAGEGVGFTLNVPLHAGCGDKEYLEVFRKRLQPAATEFRPDFVLVSAGFDAHEDDLLGEMRVTSEGFGRLTRIVKEIADACCQGRIVSVLEGGYELDGLAESIEVHLRALAE